MSKELSTVGRLDLETAFLILRDDSKLKIEEIRLLRAELAAVRAENARWVRIIKKYEARFASITRIMSGR